VTRGKRFDCLDPIARRLLIATGARQPHPTVSWLQGAPPEPALVSVNREPTHTPHRFASFAPSMRVCPAIVYMFMLMIEAAVDQGAVGLRAICASQSLA